MMKRTLFTRVIDNRFLSAAHTTAARFVERSRGKRRKRFKKTSLRLEQLEQRRLLTADLLELPLPMSPVGPFGARGYQSNIALNLAEVNETDVVTVPLTIGDSLSVQIVPSTAQLQARLRLLDPANNVIADRSAPVAGSPVSISDVLITTNGTYRIQVSSLAASGAVTLSALSSVTVETELGILANDTLATAEDLSGKGLAIGSGLRYLVSGANSGDSDWYRFPVNAGQSVQVNAVQSTNGSIELASATGSIIAIAERGNISSFVATANGELGIRVSNFEPQRSTYTFAVSVGAALSNNSSDEYTSPQPLTSSAIAYGRLSDQASSSVRVAVHADPSDGNETAVINQLNDDTYFDFTATRVLTSQIDTLAELLAYDIVVLGTPYEQLTPAAASALREFSLMGGGVIATGWFAFAYGGITLNDPVGQALNQVLPVTIGSTRRTASDAVTPTSLVHPITAGVNPFVFSGQSDYYAAIDSDAVVLARANGNVDPVVVTSERGGRSVYLGPAYFWSYTQLRSGDGDRLLEQAVAWAARKNTVDSFSFVANPGAITVTATPRHVGSGAPINDAQMSIELYSLDSATPGTPVAVVGPASAGTAPPVLSYSHATGAPGRFVATVRSLVGDGDYDVVVTNALPMPPVGQLTLMSTSIPSGRVNLVDNTVVVSFDRPLLFTSLQASDLVIGTLPAPLSVTPIDARTVSFDISNLVFNDGVYNVTLSGLSGLDGTSLSTFNSTFTLDTVPPQITNVTATTTVNGQAADVAFNLSVSEPLNPSTIETFPFRIEARDLTRSGADSVFNANSAVYDAANNRLTVSFSGLPQSRYVFYVDTGFSNVLTDVAGNVIDAGATGQSQSVLQYPFDVDLNPIATDAAPQSPLGAGVFAMHIESVAGVIGDVDEFTVDIEAGANISVVAEPIFSLDRLQVEIVNSTGAVVATASSPVTGGRAKLPSQIIASAGVYTVRTTALSTLGRYRVNVNLGSGLESENGAGANDTLASAEIPGMTPRVLAGTATTTAITGRLGIETKLAGIENIGLSSQLASGPVALTRSTLGGGDFLLSTGNSLYAVGANGSLVTLLPDLPTYALALLPQGSNILLGSFNAQLLVIDPVTGVQSAPINLTRSDNGSVFQVNSLVRDANNNVYVLFEGSGISGTALARLNLTTGALSQITQLGSTYSSIALDSQDRLFAFSLSEGPSGIPELHELRFAGAIPFTGTVQTSIVHQFFAESSFESAMVFDNSGQLYRATSAAAAWQRLTIGRTSDLSDTFQVNLAAGQWLSLALSRSDVRMEMYSSTGQLLAVGSLRGNLQAIEGFVAPSAGNYSVRLSSQAPAADYRLVFSRDANLGLGDSQGVQPVPPSGVLYGRSGVSVGGSIVVVDQPTTFSRTVFDSANYRWDIQSNGTISDGSSDAYDGGMILNGFNGLTNGFQDASGRAFRVGPSTVSGLSTVRSIYVPTNDTFARFIDSFTNNSASPITTTVSYFTNLGSDGSTFAIATSSGDLALAPQDRWILTDDSSSTGGDPAVGHIFYGPGGLQPSTATRSGDNVNWSYPITVNPGQTVSLMSFAVQNFNRTASEAAVRRVAELSAGTLNSLPEGIAGTIANWTVNLGTAFNFNVANSTAVRIQTTTPGDATGAPANLADPLVGLYYLDSATPLFPVAVDDNGASDNRNALLNYNVLPAATGRYGFNIGGFPTGDYVAVLSATQANDIVITNTLSANFADIADGGSFRSFPARIRVQFNADVDVTTVAASDLRLNGVPAQDVQIIDGRTLEFDATNAFSGDGAYLLAISGGSFTSLRGAPVAALTRSFTVDISAPRVTASTVSTGATVTPGQLVYQVTFNEQLAVAGLGPEDFTIQAAGGLAVPANSMLYDPNLSIATVTFDSLIENTYTLRISSSSTGVRDLLGNLLDGNPSFPLPSGDGVAGDDFVVSFTVDAGTTSLPTPVAGLLPIGGRVYSTQASALIGQAGDTDRFTIPLKAGQAFFAAVQSLNTLAARLRMFDPSGIEMSTGVTAAGGTFTSSLLTAPADGIYALLVESADTSLGNYQVSVTLGAAPEAETTTQLNNDSIALAEDLVFLAVQPADVSATAATQAAVVGQGGSLDHFRLTAVAGRPLSISAAVLPSATGLPSGGLALLALDGTLLAVGSDRADGVVQDILEFVPAANGPLIVRINAAEGSKYQVVVADGAALDVEPNDNSLTAQRVQAASTVLGGVAVGGSSFNVDFSDAVGGLSLDQFVATGLWHVTNACDSNPAGHSAPNFAYFGIDANCNFDAGSVSGRLTSPPLGLRAGTSPVLRLKYRLGSEGGQTYDRAEVLVSTNGGTSFTKVADKATHFSQASVWTAREIDLSAYAGQSVILAFSFATGDGVANSGLGWQIDDLEVTGVADLEDYFAFPAAVGDALAVRAIPFESLANQPVGTLAPQLELIGPSGLVVAAGLSELNYSVPANAEGVYRVRLSGSGAGDYRLTLSGSSANRDSAAQTLSSVPANGQSLATAPTRLQLTFDQGIRIDSVQATDLVFADGAVSVSSIEVIDGSTLAFVVAVPSNITGNLPYSIAAGAIADLQGTPIAAVTGSFTIDRVGPLVLNTLPATQASAPFSTFTFVFNEPLDRNTVDISDILAFTSPIGTDLRSQISSVVVNGTSVSVNFSAQNAAGNYTISIGGLITDEVGNQMDQNGNGIVGESADVFTRTIALQSPDLRPVVNSVNGTNVFGQTLTINYTVSNIGNDPALERWRDRIHLSTNTTLDRDDLLLITSPGANSLGPLEAVGGSNASYTRSIDVTLPLTISLASGTYYLLVEADASGTQPEASEANNVAATTALTINLPPLPDLVIESIVVPTAALSGQQIPLQWQIANRGTGNFSGTFIDTVRLSTDNVVGNDAFLANFSFIGTIPAGTSVTRQQLITLPISTEGTRHFVFTTDAGNEVFEHVGENNNAVVSSAIAVTLAPLPNLRVTSVTPPTGAFSSQPTTVNFVVTNTGTGPTTSPIWYDAVYLSSDGALDGSDIYLGARVNPGFLEPAASYASSLQVTLPRGISGDYQLIVVSDSDNRVYEHQFENDNITASAVFPVTLTPPPDLQVQTVTGPFTAFSGSMANVSWTVANNGTGRTLETSWYDDIYLSSDQTLDGNDVHLGSTFHNGFLNPGSTYTVVNQPFRLPIGISGNYHFIVVADQRNDVYESLFESNNVGRSTATTDVRLTPPPDLLATFSSLPSALSAGRELSVAFTVTNNGVTATAENSWSDRVFLSSDAVLDATDLLVQSKTHFGNLGVFQSYTETLTARLPWSLAAGNYFLIVATDFSNNVFELNDANNILASSNALPLTIAPPDLIPLTLTTSTTLLAGQTFSAAWNVQNNGIGSTSVSRRDDLILSTDSVLGNNDDRLLKNVAVNSQVTVGNTQTITTDNVVLPLDLATGAYTLFVRVDAGSEQFESNESNNTFGPISLTVTQTLPDLIAENVMFSPATLVSQGRLTVDWTTRNQGAAATNSGYWLDRIYLSSDNALGSEDRWIGTLSHNSVLAAGGTRARQAVLDLPEELSGDYFVIIASDNNDQVLEGGGESNNTAVSASKVNITLAPTPDLRVTTVDAPATGFSGQQLSVSWTVINSGATAAVGNWYDAVYLSADQIFDRSADTYVGFRNRPSNLPTSGLAVGATYNQTASFEIPLGLAGPLYAFVATDSGERIFERGGELNNSHYDSVPVNITLLPPADLVVGNITIPPNSAVGSTATIAYSVRNQGVNPARGQWLDSLFLSTDATYSIDDLPLGAVLHNGDVPGLGGEYSEVLNTRLPGVIPGSYKIIVRSDIRNAIAESNEANNISGSLDSFAINLPQLVLGVPATGQLNVGETLFWTIQLTAGDSVRFRLDNATAEATSELFIRRGAIPSRSQFDFAANVPFTNDPSVVVPAESGIYYVMAYGASGASNNGFNLLAEVVPLSVFSVAANTIGSEGRATVKVSGAQYSSDTEFYLVDSDNPTIATQAVRTIVSDSVTAFVTFVATNLPNGIYDLVAANDGQTARLADSVTVAETITGDVLLQIDGAERVRPDRVNPFRVQYVNDGNTDAVSPLLIVENPDGLELGFSESDVAVIDLHLFGYSNDGDSNVLRPGVIGSIPVAFRSSNTGIVSMPVRPVSTSDTRTITNLQWLGIERSIRSLGVSDSVWLTNWARIQPRIGATWGAYARFVQTVYEAYSMLESTDTTRKGDVRGMLAQVLAHNANWRPSNVVSGRIAETANNIGLANVTIGAYRREGDNQILAGSTVTNADGSFSFVALPIGSYSLALASEQFAFDSNRDGKVDGLPYRFTVEQSDLTGLDLSVTRIPIRQPAQQQPSIAVDSSGTSHIVWIQSDVLWHASSDANGNWVGAQPISGASGQSPVLLTGDNLVAGGPGLMVVFQAGNGNASELFYSLGRRDGSTSSYLWSTPTRLTNDLVHDGAFAAAVASDGLPVVLSQRLDIGDSTSETVNDTDIYSSSFTPTGSFSAALEAALEAAQTTGFADQTEITPSGTHRITIQPFQFGPVTIPDRVPIFGGTHEANFRAAATVDTDSCSPSGSISADGQIKVGGKNGSAAREGNIRGAGSVKFKSQGTKGNCEYVFDNASLSFGGGIAFDSPTIPLVPLLGPYSFIVGFLLNPEGGLRIEAQTSGNAHWGSDGSLEALPDDLTGSLRISVGGFVKLSTPSGLKKLAGAELLVRVLGNANWTINSPTNWDFNGLSLTVLVRGQIKWGGFKRFVEYTHTWNDIGGLGANALEQLGGSFDALGLVPSSLTEVSSTIAGIEPLGSFGTLTNFSGSGFNVVTQDTLQDSDPSVARAPDGTLYGLWSNANGIHLYTFNANSDTWGIVNSLNVPTGIEAHNAQLSFDSSGQGIIVFAQQDVSGLSLSSTEEELKTAFRNGGDIYYATYNPTSNLISAPQPLFTLAGDDSNLSLLRLAGGDLIAVWNHTDSDTNQSLFSSRWNQTAGTWSSATAIASNVMLTGTPRVSMIGGIPTAIWSQIEGAVDNQGNVDQTIPSRMRVSQLINGVWTAPGEFTYQTPVSTTIAAASANGSFSQLYKDAANELVVVSRGAQAGGWSVPYRLSTVGSVVLEQSAIAYDLQNTAVVTWIEVITNADSGETISQVRYAYMLPGTTQWSTPKVVFSSNKGLAQIRLEGNTDGGLHLIWTANDDTRSQSLYTATWNAGSGSLAVPKRIASDIAPNSLSSGRVAADSVLVWRQARDTETLHLGLTFATYKQGSWSLPTSAESLVHAQVEERPENVTREEIRQQSFDQYNMGLVYLLAQHFTNFAFATGTGIYLRSNGILPFSPPEDCCKCEKLDERTVGTDEGCGSSTKVDQENCVRITTYKPCVERPRDPNDILGPEGFGEERWVSSLELLSYRIRFENAADANAAAQLVDVTQTLDEDLSLPTFQLKGFGFRGFNFTVPGSPPFYSTVIDMTQQLGLLVEFTAGINVATREAFWRLVALDPATGQPPLNPDLGLLIPNDADGNGEGYLDYTITAKPNVTTGTRIDAQARIVFDTEEPIDTPPIFNTLDATAPTSGVIAGTTPTQPEFTVMWSGNDQTNGSGLASYTILVSENDGDYSIWLDETTATEAVFTGTAGATYAFLSLAADNANNLEALPSTPDWTVTLPGGVAAIGDFVWNDLNDNGIQDAGESGVGGVAVTLFADNGTVNGIQVATTNTAANGSYSFANVPTDVSYFLTIVAPAGFAIGKPLQGTNALLDSNFAIDGKTAVFTVNNGDNLSFDAALVETGSIAGTVWEDLDGDGIRDAGEPNLVGWTIYLDLNDNGSLDASEPTRLTNSAGQYSFNDLRPGSYVVAEVVQPGYVQTYPGAAGASATNRSYVRSASQAQLFLPSMDGETSGVLSSDLASSATSIGIVDSPASRWISLDGFLADPRFANTSAGTVVVIDTGIDVDHPFFGPDNDGNGVADRIVYQYDFADNDFDASDMTGHGSHVTSLIAGQDATYPGVAPGANIIALKVFKDSGHGTFTDVERALEWVIEHASTYSIDAINLSVGDGLNWSDTIGGYGISDELSVLAEMGVIAVAAAGNGYGLFNSPGLAYPAADPNTISVGAVWDSNRDGPWRFGLNGTDYSTGAGRITSFSQRDSDMLDVFAPGAILTGANQFGGVSAMRGTSMSAPQVSGAALWAQSIARSTLGRSLSTAEFRYLVRQSGTRLVDGDDENDSVFNTGATFAGLNLLALGEAILTYDGSYAGSGFTSNHDSGGGLPGTSSGRPNRYLINLAPGQDRVVVDFGNKLADIQAPQIVGFSTVTPSIRNSGITSIDVTFSEAIDPSSFAASDFVLSRGGSVVALDGATLTEISPTTWRLAGLSGLTNIEGSYNLTLQGSSIRDLSGNVGEGVASSTFTIDTASPVGTIVPFGSFQPNATFNITVAGQDPTSGGVSSGIAAYEIYRQINGGEFALWTTVPAATPTAQYTAQSNQTLGFYAIAIDLAGNRESSSAREVATLVGDVDLPVTAVNSVNTLSPAMTVHFSGSDTGGSGLVAFELMVSIDGATPQLAGRLNLPPTQGTTSGSLIYQAIQDGSPHSYRFFTIGVDAAGQRELSPPNPQDVTVTAAYVASSSAEITNFRVQSGILARSYIRQLEVDFSLTILASGIATTLNDSDSGNDRMTLLRFANDGSGAGVPIDLITRVTATNHTVTVDFGVQGIGGDRNATAGDGYYELRVDVDGNSSNGNEALLTFYRLLGDSNGDRVVDTSDVNNVDAAFLETGIHNSDLNGDLVVNTIDRALVRRSLGNQIAPSLPLTNPNTLGIPRVTAFDVQNGQRQRSFLNEIDTTLSRASLVDAIVASLTNANASDDRIKMERFDLNGTGTPTLIDLTTRASAVDRVLTLNFGTTGLPDGGNSDLADGYYRISIDLDGNVSNGYESQLHFFRLLGDVNGDGIVNQLDSAAVNTGNNPEADVNGDGSINLVDRILVTRSQGRSINPTLLLDD